MKNSFLPIGGYFSLELPDSGSLYHDRAILLNTARNALEYIIRSQSIHKLYLPYYICKVVIEKIESLNVEYTYYGVTKAMEIEKLPRVKKNEKLLYVNYFSTKDNYIKKLLEECGPSALIIDASQAFYSRPLLGVDTIYSPRKFFGVSDGAMLYTQHIMQAKPLPRDYSVERMRHLLGRIDQEAEDYYNTYLENDNMLSELPMAMMSALTERILRSIDYKSIYFKRKSNAILLHKELGNINQFPCDPCQVFAYPFLVEDGTKLRENLRKQRIYIPVYWKEVPQVTDRGVENKLTNDLLPLPIDQRYDEHDMWRIINAIRMFMKKRF